MASILNNEPQIVIIDNMRNLEPGDLMEYEYDQTVSLWITEKNIIRPSYQLTVSSKLEPGVYMADYDRDFGYFCRKLNYSSDELFVFSDSITEKLLNEINLFWEKKDLYAENKLIHKRGILLEGYPGTGKSSIVTQLSDAIIAQGGVVFKVQNFRMLDSYIQFMKTGFRQIQPDTPVITILEDIDQYEQVETELLDFLDGKTGIDHHVVIATTNNTEEISDTFLRPSRLDLKIEIPLSSAKTREEYFKFKNVPEELICELVNNSEGCSLADLKEIYICMFLLGYSMEDAIAKVKTPREKKNYLSFPTTATKMGL